MNIAQTNMSDAGQLQVRVTSSSGFLPVENASIEISYTGDPSSVIEKLSTDKNGVSETIDLDAPPLEYSMEPSENQPYSEYTIRVSAPDFNTITVTGSELMPTVKSIQNVSLTPLFAQENPVDVLTIGPHTLFGNYPPKIAESEIKPLDESGEIVLSRVVVPEYIVVHDGSVTDTTASNYYVKYKDYIKNVAACEIYSTWPRSTIEANVLAIMSFTLNRVYTEWYRNKGIDFTITSSTAFDHKWNK